MIRLADPRLARALLRVPLLRRLVAREGDAMMGLISGFVQSQMLYALVESGTLGCLADGETDPGRLARAAGLPDDGFRLMARAVAAMGLVHLRRGRVRLTSRGAILASVPGLTEMIRHHDVLYRDLADPLAVLRGDGGTELARFWPYVMGSADGEVAERYSRLMADSQALVAEDTLDAVDLAGVTRLMDVGGGTGAFLAAALTRHPNLRGTLVDLPAVTGAARASLVRAGVAERVDVVGASFRDDGLPQGADAVSLVRVLYDHAEDTVAALLAAVFVALPPGGRLVVSEPMTGGDRPHVSGDVYFALYTRAMGTGRARSQAEIAAHLRAAGFDRIATPAPRRPFVTAIVTARRPELSNVVDS